MVQETSLRFEYAAVVEAMDSDYTKDVAQLKESLQAAEARHAPLETQLAEFQGLLEQTLTVKEGEVARLRRLIGEQQKVGWSMGRFSPRFLLTSLILK